MKAMVDLNVLMDVLQRRYPFFASAAALCEWGETRGNVLAVPAHAMTTISYIVRKTAGAKAESDAIDWLLDTFEIVPAGTDVFRRAKALGMDDFEDAVVAAGAEASHCEFIVTRNMADFAKATVPAIPPAEFLAMAASSPPARK